MLLNLLQQVLPVLVAAAAVAAVLSTVVGRIFKNQRIKKLGGRAKAVKSVFFGIDETWKLMQYAKQNKNREAWEERIAAMDCLTWESSVVGKRLILTADPENIKAILATQFHDFGKGEEFHRKWFPLLGNSIFSTDGKQWHDSRQLIRPQFIKDRVADLHTFERHIQHMLSLTPHDGSTVDIGNLMYRLTLDTATDFLLGSSVNSLDNPAVGFAEAFAMVQKHLNDVTRLGPLSPLLLEKDFKRNLKVLNDFVEPFVERTLQMRSGDLKDRKDTEYNFLHALAEYTKDPRMLRDQLVAVLLAARDTTAGTLSWAIYELCQKPECVGRLREEILGRIGPNNPPTYVDLKEMKYLQNVLNETLRLYPAVPFNIRFALKDTTLPHGNASNPLEPIGVLAGTPVGYSTLTMQRRQDMFGPDVDEFIPERWETWQPKPWYYIPFNGGPRICIGQHFALTEMAYVLARLLQRFEIVEDRNTKPQFERCEVTITPGAGVYVGLKPAKDN